MNGLTRRPSCWTASRGDEVTQETHFLECLAQSRCAVNIWGCCTATPGLPDSAAALASQAQSTPQPAGLRLLGEAGPGRSMELCPPGSQADASISGCRFAFNKLGNFQNGLSWLLGASCLGQQAWGHQALEISRESGVEILSSGPQAPSSMFFPAQLRGFDPKNQGRRQRRRQEGSGRRRCPGPALPGLAGLRRFLVTPHLPGNCRAREVKYSLRIPQGWRRRRECHLVARSRSSEE